MTFAKTRIIVPRNRFLRWQQRLRDRLALLYPTAQIDLHGDARGEDWPSGVAPLLSLEKLLLRRTRPTLSDRQGAFTTATHDAYDLTIDLTGETGDSSGAPTLRPLYDGEPSDHYAVTALLSGRAPMLAIQDVATGVILAQGLPSLEAADGLTGGLEAVYSRIITLLEQTLARPAQPLDPAPVLDRPAPPHPAAFALRNIAYQCARAIYHLCCHSPHWRVGWRFVSGPGVIETGSLGDGNWRPMEDRGLSFAADPFPIEWRGRLGVFYERLDYSTDKGLIYFQEFGPDGPSGEPVCALEEPWHLSYPFLIEDDGELYMLPEASASDALTLYRCIEFPHRWERVAQLLNHIEMADATIVRQDGRFYMTSVIRDGVGGYSDTLAIHHATQLLGPWEEHALRPALVDSRYARPAGAIVRSNGSLLRPVQDCSEGYGRRLTIMRIDALSPERFSQTPIATLAPGGVWPGKRLHTINRYGPLECIDGAIFSPKNVALRRLINGLAESRANAARPGALAFN